MAERESLRTDRDQELFSSGPMGQSSAVAVGKRTVEIAAEVRQELDSAISRFKGFNSPHEGWAVIREELDELWEHVKANTADGPEARKEAIQVAAMAMRFVYDLSARAE